MRTYRLGARQAAGSAALGDMQAEAEGDTRLPVEAAGAALDRVADRCSGDVSCAASSSVRGPSAEALSGRGSLRPRLGCRPEGAGRGHKLRSRLTERGCRYSSPPPWPGLRWNCCARSPRWPWPPSVTTARVLPGTAPRPDWPGQGEAAAGLPGTGLLGTHGGSAAGAHREPGQDHDRSMWCCAAIRCLRPGPAR